MCTLVVVAYDNEYQAEDVRLRLLKMQKEYLVDLEDAAIAVRKADGKIKLHQLYNLTGAGAVSGGFWGLLVGLIFMNPLLGAVVGAGAGAVSGALADVGVDDNFMKKLASSLKPGSSMLFILFRSITLDKALQELEGTGGTIIQTSLSHEDEARLRSALNEGAPAMSKPIENANPIQCDAAEETISRNASQGSALRCCAVQRPAPEKHEEPAVESQERPCCDAAEETISRNASQGSALRCCVVQRPAPEKHEEPAAEMPERLCCDAAEETISRNASQNSGLRCSVVPGQAHK